MNIINRVLCSLAISALPSYAFGSPKINVTDTSQDALLSVSIYDVDVDRQLDVVKDGFNTFSSEITSDVQASSRAYRNLFVTFTWSVAEGSESISNSTEMKIEFPILLKAWEPVDVNFRMNYFAGLGERNVLQYEGSWPREEQFERLVGALLMRQHFEINLGDPFYKHVVRITKVAVSAARQVANNREWFVPPTVLDDYVSKSFSNASEQQRQLVLELASINARKLNDLLEVENILALEELSCDQWSDFFTQIANEATNHPIAEKVFYPDGNFENILEQKQKIVRGKLGCSF